MSKTMEQFNNEKYQYLSNVEDLFKMIGCYGKEYNYCFGASVPPSFLSTALLVTQGAIGGLLAANLQKNKLYGFLVNKYEKGLCLIPLYLDHQNNTLMDLKGYLNFKNEEIIDVKIKWIDISWRKVTISFLDNQKIIMHVIKKNKAFPWHKNNFQKFTDIYK